MGRLLTVGEYQILEILMRLPDDAWLTVEEAAVVLRVSVSALNKWRLPANKGRGPIYSQGGGTDAKGSNQKVLYKKSDLLAWHEANKVSDTHQAAVRKGQMFRTLADLLEPVAVWIRDGVIGGLVDRTPLDVFIERVDCEPREWEVAWIPAHEAAASPWDDPAAHREFAAEINTTLGNAKDAVSAAVDASEMRAALEG